MKMMLALFTGLLFLSACKMQQDPIAGAPQAIREGHPPSVAKPVQEKPLDKNALQIDSPTLINGRVGSPVEFSITGRVMTAGVSFNLTIDNLVDFPGATFDAAKGEFKWTPSKTIMSGFPSIEIPLHVTMATVPSMDVPTVSVERKKIVLVISNVYSKPIINSITGPSPIVTGGRYTYSFQIEDLDALNEKDVGVEVRDCDSYPTSLGHLVSIKRIEVSPSLPNTYVGEAVLNLSSVDSMRADTYCFSLMAISKHGVVSEQYKKEFAVETKMKSTKMTIDRDIEVNVGEKMKLSFAIYDPTGVGTISVSSKDDIAKDLPGSSLVCNQSWTTFYLLNCDAVIDATTAKPASYPVKLVIENAGSRSNQKTVTNHTLRIQVKAVKP